jgi:hypothetical protein
MFGALEAGDFQSIEGIVTQLASYFNPSPTAGPRKRGSVRRASGFVQIIHGQEAGGSFVLDDAPGMGIISYAPKKRNCRNQASLIEFLFWVCKPDSVGGDA